MSVIASVVKVRHTKPTFSTSEWVMAAMVAVAAVETVVADEGDAEEEVLAVLVAAHVAERQHREEEGEEEVAVRGARPCALTTQIPVRVSTSRLNETSVLTDYCRR